MTPIDHADMSNRITTMDRAGHCMSLQTFQGSQRTPDCWNTKAVAVCILANVGNAKLGTSMAVDLLLGSFRSAPELLTPGGHSLLPLAKRKNSDVGSAQRASGRFCLLESISNNKLSRPRFLIVQFVQNPSRARSVQIK